MNAKQLSDLMEEEAEADGYYDDDEIDTEELDLSFLDDYEDEEDDE